MHYLTNQPTNKLTNYMEQSYSYKSNNHLATQ
jgi:hypothetical protein